MTNAVNIAQSGSNNQTMRNRIINGAMVIDQRNNGASVTINSDQFTLDRWQAFTTQTGRYSVQRNAGSVTPPAGFTNYLGVTSLSTSSLAAGDYYLIRQSIEGFNFADISWGTANAQPITISFWVRSSLTGTFGGALQNNDSNLFYAFTYTINSANTWEYKTITIGALTTGTWATNAAAGLRITFGLGVGSTFSGTAGVWGSGALLSATGAVNVLGTNGATWYITGVQIEEGTAASPFEYRLYTAELAFCQRYYQIGIASSATAQGTTAINGRIQLLQEMRATPSLGKVGTNYNFGDMVSVGFESSATPTIATYGYQNINVAFNLGSFPASLVAYRSYRHEPSDGGGISGRFSMSAEL